jgi:hypothetical protein
LGLKKLFAILVIVGTAGLLEAIPPPSPAKRHHGVVLKAGSHRPVPRVRIVAYPVDGPSLGCKLDTLQTETNDRGGYELYLGGCTMDIEYSRPGFETMRVRWPDKLAVKGDIRNIELEPVRLQPSGE